MNKLYAWVAKLILNKIFVGKGATVIGWAFTIIGIYNIIFSAENMQALCDSHQICLAANKTFGFISAAIGEISKLLRFGVGVDAPNPPSK